MILHECTFLNDGLTELAEIENTCIFYCLLHKSNTFGDVPKIFMFGLLYV